MLKRSEEWKEFSKADPLRFYFVASEQGWEEGAAACARLLVERHETSTIPTLYTPEMESIGSAPYRRLLVFSDAVHGAASADFTLSGLPSRTCSTPPAGDNPCCALYPASLSTASPPSWLKPHFKPITDTLCKKPCWTFSRDLRLVHAFVEAIASGLLPCAQLTPAGSMTNPEWLAEAASQASNAPQTPHAKCTRDSNIAWAVAVLQAYEKAVKEAVAQASRTTVDPTVLSLSCGPTDACTLFRCNCRRKAAEVYRT